MSFEQVSCFEKTTLSMLNILRRWDLLIALANFIGPKKVFETFLSVIPPPIY